MVSTVVAARFQFSTCTVVLLRAKLAARMVAARITLRIAIVMAIAFDPESSESEVRQHVRVENGGFTCENCGTMGIFREIRLTR